MHSLKRLEKVFHAIVPRRVRYAIKDAARRAVKAVRTHARADRRPRNDTSQSIPDVPWAAESRTAGPGVVILVADPVDRSIFAGMITDEWCRVEDPAVYVPRSEDYVYAPESVVGALSAGELRSAYFSLLHEPNDVVIISRSIESLPAVAVSSLRQSTLVCAAGHEWLLHGRPFRKPIRGRVMRLLVHRDAAVIDTSIDRLLGCRCYLVGQQFHVQGLPGHHSLPSPRHEPTVRRPPTASAGDRPTMLVLPALFAVGGVERNTVEVLAKLQDRYRFVIVTNEPHEPARGSLHRQLEGLCEAVYDLGEMADATHHADILAALHDLHRFDCAWIVNGSPWLSRNLSTVREILSDCAIVDQQVYDTVHGWISCYQDQAIKSFDRHVAINSLIADAFVNRFGIPKDRVDLVYHAIDSDRWSAVAADADRRVRARDRLAAPRGAAVYGFIGRLTEQKRPMDFLDMAKRSAEEGRPDLFLVVGDGTLAGECHAFVRQHGLSNVRCTGFVPDPADLLLSLSGLVITSEYEGLPIVSLESMAIGLPILATDVGDLRVVAESHRAAVTIITGSDGTTRYEEFRRWSDTLSEQTAQAEQASAGVRAAFGADVIAERYHEVFRAAMQARRAETTEKHRTGARFRRRGDHASVSIVMPTFNRRDRLACVLDRYDEVTGGIDHEIVIVDDGSTDGTADLLSTRARSNPRLRHCTVRNGGPGRARNVGAALATKDVVLFVGDDIFPRDERFVRTHARLHAAHPEAGFSVLGKVVWPSDGSLDITPVMRHVQGAGGEQFGFAHLLPYASLDWRFFYTCNVSVKRSIVTDWETEGFSADFTAAAFEDGEFAYRMSARPGGLRIYYDPASVGEHHHAHSVRSFLDRQFNAGRMAAVLIARHPETATVLGLSPLVAEMGHGGRRRQPDRVADLLSVIEGAKAFAMLLEAYGGLGDSLWHTSYLQAVFELAMLHGFVIGRSTHGADTEAGYVRILGGFLRRVEPILATELPGSRGLVESIRSRLAA